VPETPANELAKVEEGTHPGPPPPVAKSVPSRVIVPVETSKVFTDMSENIPQDFSRMSVEMTEKSPQTFEKFAEEVPKKKPDTQINFSTPTAELPLEFGIPDVQGTGNRYVQPPQPVFAPPPTPATMRDANGNLLVPTTNEYGQIVYVAAAPAAPVYVQPTYAVPTGYTQYPGAVAYPQSPYIAPPPPPMQRPAAPPRSFSAPPPPKTSFAQKSPPLPPRMPKPPVPKPMTRDVVLPKTDTINMSVQETSAPIEKPNIIDFDNMDKIGITTNKNQEDDIQIAGFKKYDPNAVVRVKRDENSSRTDEEPKHLDRIDRAFQKKMAKMEAEKEKEIKKKK
jgi:hypothetical protein